jgi:plastocyanin
MKKNRIAAMAAATILTMAIIAAASTTATPTAATATTTEEEEQQRVAVGGILDGNLTVSVNQFSPAAVEIQTGESITFYAPENSTEVHNVIFDLSNRTTISGNELPFILPQGVNPEQLELAPPFNFGESIIQEQQPDGRQAIITLNKVAYYPAVADWENNTRYLIDVEEHEQLVEEARQQGFFEPQNLSANYTLNGTEKVVSSGIILDVGGFDALFAEEEGEAANMTATEATDATTATDANATTEAATSPIPPAEIGQENATTTAPEQEGGEEEEFPPLPYPILNSFTVTFEQPGTYEYFCTFHPGMFGIVTVAGEEGEAANMTVTTDATDTNATTAVTAAEQEGEEQQQQQQQTTPTIPPAPNPLFE